MKLLLLLLFTISTLGVYGQSDTVFFKYNTSKIYDSLSYSIDTVVFASSMFRNVIIGTSALPWTSSQQEFKGLGIYLDKVSKIDCDRSGRESKNSIPVINSFEKTDSSLVVDLIIYENCCYDFLCDVSLKEGHQIVLEYKGYGALCGCRCCFGLSYHFTISSKESLDAIDEIVIDSYPTSAVELE